MNTMAIPAGIAELEDEMIALRHRIHAHPELAYEEFATADLVAERLVRYAKLVGRENVIGGTDCGIGPRVGHPSICWAKLEALAEGARRATKELWKRA